MISMWWTLGSLRGLKKLAVKGVLIASLKLLKPRIVLYKTFLAVDLYCLLQA